MSHALTLKALTGEDSKVEVYTDTCRGVTYYPTPVEGWRNSLISAAGSLGNMIFSTLKNCRSRSSDL